MNRKISIPFILAPWPACRAVFPPAPPAAGPFACTLPESHAADPAWLCWLATGFAFGLCLAWFYRRILLAKGMGKDRARAGPDELDLARNAQDSTEEILRSLPRREMVARLADRAERGKGKRL